MVQHLSEYNRLHFDEIQTIASCHTFSRHKHGVEQAIDRALDFLHSSEKNIVLKQEQKEVITALLSGNDASAVLPTGFGKSIIFVMFALVARELKRDNTVVQRSNG